MLKKKGAAMIGKSLAINQVIIGVILLVVLFEVLAEALPLINVAGNALNNTGLPLAGFFETNGIIMLAIMGAVVIIVVGFVLVQKGAR